MFIFPRQNKSKTHSVDETNSRKTIQEFLQDTNKFLKTTTGIITSLTLLIGATSSLTLAIFRISTQDACSDASLSIKYLQEQPLRTSPYKIKTEYGSVDMEISVYKDGDILTTYGKNRKWLCFSEITRDTATQKLLDFLIPQAVAQPTVSNVKDRNTYIQRQTRSPHNSQIIEQTRIYSNGTVEKVRINRRTGIILDKNISTTTITPELQEQLEHGTKVEETTIIDIR